MDASLYQFLERGDTVLCASQRLAHRLRLDYAEIAQRAGKVVWPTPAINTLNHYLVDAFKQQRQTQALLPRLMNELQTQWSWENIVSHDDSHSLLSAAQAARRANHSWQLLHQYRIPLEKIAEYSNEEAQVFYRWAKAFVAHTQARNAIDSTRLIAWIHNSRFVPQGIIHFAGFDQFVPAQQVLIDHWKNQGCNILVHAMPAINKTVQVVATKDMDDELQNAARWARAQLEQGRQHIGVIVADLNNHHAQVRRIFNGILSPASRSALHDYESVVSISASVALTAYPLVHHALLALQLMLDQSDVLSWGVLLRSPFITGYTTEATARALLDVQLRKQQHDQWSAEDIIRRSAGSCPLFSASLQAALTSRSAHPDKALPSEWTDYFNQLLSAMGWARGRTLHSDEQQTCGKFYEVLAQLSSLDEVAGRINGITALQLLRAALQQTRFAPESIDQAITITEEDSAAGMQFDALWITGLHADAWPTAAEPDAFIPVELQYQYRVSSARADSCYQFAKHQLQRLVQCATEVVLSWPQQDKDVMLRPSTLLSSLHPDVTTPTISRSTVKTLLQTLFQHKPSLESVNDMSLPLHPGGVIKHGSRVFELQSRCAFKAQAELRLHAVEMESPEPGISSLDRGKLLHRILQDIWNRLQDWHGLQAALRDEHGLRMQVQQVADREAQALFQALTHQRQRLISIEVQVAVDVVMQLLKHESNREMFSVIRSETREEMDVNGLRLHIQPDRIDQMQDGSLLLIDYKSGKNYHVKDWLDMEVAGRPRSPQLPLYALTRSERLCGIAYSILAPGIAELRGLADRDGISANIKDYSRRQPRYKMSNVDNWQDLLMHWQQVINDLAAQFKQGVATADPLKNECQYCALTSLCRVKEMGVDVDMEEESDDE